MRDDSAVVAIPWPTRVLGWSPCGTLLNRAAPFFTVVRGFPDGCRSGSKRETGSMYGLARFPTHLWIRTHEIRQAATGTLYSLDRRETRRYVATKHPSLHPPPSLRSNIAFGELGSDPKSTVTPPADCQVQATRKRHYMICGGDGPLERVSGHMLSSRQRFQRPAQQLASSIP